MGAIQATRSLTRCFSTAAIEAIENIPWEKLSNEGNGLLEGKRKAGRAVTVLEVMNPETRFSYLRNRNDDANGMLASFLVMNGYVEKVKSYIEEYHINDQVNILSSANLVPSIAEFDQDKSWLKDKIFGQSLAHQKTIILNDPRAAWYLIENGGAADEIISLIRQAHDKEIFLKLPFILYAFNKAGKTSETKDIICRLSSEEKSRIAIVAQNVDIRFQIDLAAFGLGEQHNPNLKFDI